METGGKNLFDIHDVLGDINIWLEMDAKKLTPNVYFLFVFDEMTIKNISRGRPPFRAEK